jgi:hypothetical protein
VQMLVTDHECSQLKGGASEHRSAMSHSEGEAEWTQRCQMRRLKAFSARENVMPHDTDRV